MKLLTRSYRLPDGRDSEWDLLDGGRTVAVLAVTPEQRVILARQFRPGPGAVLDELPGGYVDEGEDPVEAGRRELLEETGFGGRLELAGSTWLLASATTRRFVVVARECVPQKEAHPVGDEFTEIMLVTLDELRERLRAGEMTDVDAGYLALDHLGLL